MPTRSARPKRTTLTPHTSMRASLPVPTLHLTASAPPRPQHSLHSSPLGHTHTHADSIAPSVPRAAELPLLYPCRAGPCSHNLGVRIVQPSGGTRRGRVVSWSAVAMVLLPVTAVTTVAVPSSIVGRRHPVTAVVGGGWVGGQTYHSVRFGSRPPGSYHPRMLACDQINVD